MIGDAEDLGQRVRESLAAFRKTKAERVREGGPDANVNPQLVLWRGGRLAAFVTMLGEMSSPRLRMMASFAIRGLRADVAVLTYEGWAHTGARSQEEMINPDTGRRWALGEMSDYVRAHGRDGVVTDGLMVHGLSLLADVHATQTLTPRQGAFGWSISYEEPWFSDDGALLGGEMVEILREAMSAVPGVNAELANLAQETGMTEATEEAEAIADGEIARRLVLERLAMVALTATDEQGVRQATLTRMFKAAPPSDLDQARTWAPWN